MKRACAALLVLLLLVSCMTGCAEKEVSAEISEQQSENDAVGESVQDETVTETEAENETEEVEEITETEPIPQEMDVIRLDKNVVSYYEEDGYELLAKCEYSFVTMSETDVDNYTVMARALDSYAEMVRRSGEEEHDNVASFAAEDCNNDPEGFTTFIFTRDILVRRSDSVAISFLEDTYSYYLGIDGKRFLNGITFDTESGLELALADVVTDVSRLPAAAEQVMSMWMWLGELPTDIDIAGYFSSTPEEELCWTLDYNGVTFYFEPGELSEEAEEIISVTLTFEQFPDLFYEKFTVVPSEYTVEIPMGTPFYTDMNGDGVCESLSVVAWHDEESDHYRDVMISLGGSEEPYFEQCYVYAFYLFYAKTEDGSFIYLLCENSQEGERTMDVKIFEISGGRIEKIADFEAADMYASTGAINVPTDPEEFLIGLEY